MGVRHFGGPVGAVLGKARGELMREHPELHRELVEEFAAHFCARSPGFMLRGFVKKCGYDDNVATEIRDKLWKTASQKVRDRLRDESRFTPGTAWWHC